MRRRQPRGTMHQLRRIHDRMQDTHPEEEEEPG